MKEFLAYLAAVVMVVSILPYIVDIIKQRTKPNIVSWVTWAILTAIATFATFAAAEYRTALLMLASTVGVTSVVLLGLKYGFAKFSRFDLLCWLGALVGLILWWLFDSPTLAIVTTVSIDAIGTLPTIRHSWNLPGEETWQTFAGSAFAALLTLISITSFSLASALYPLYLLIANGLIVGVVVIKRKQQGISLSRHSVHETLHE